MAKLRWIGLAAVAALALVPAATSGISRPQTTEPTDIVDIRVTITDTRITLSEHTVERGVVARFLVRNIGRKTHTFNINFAGGEDFTTGMLQRNRRKTLLVFMDYRGPFQYHSAAKGDANKVAMKGTFYVV